MAPKALTSPERAARIMLYSHDTLGYGHLRRNLLIATALSELTPRPEILLICGMREAGAFALPPGVDTVTLPAYAKQSDGSYQPRDLGDDLSRLARLRSRMIRSAAKCFEPDLLVVDNVPRGAQFELDEALAMLSARGRCRIVLGLRDVIDESHVTRLQWLCQRNIQTVRRHFDAVWVYGDPTLYDALDDCGLGGSLGVSAGHVGYLDPGRRRDSAHASIDRDNIAAADPRPYVFCSVGGGRDGAALCDAFARARMPSGHRGVLVTGTQMPENLCESVRQLVAGRDDMSVEPFLREPFGAMSRAARVVAMGGYNTTMELLSIDAPVLIVPRCYPRREQLIRTERLAARGLVSMLRPDELTPAALSSWLSRDAPSARRNGSCTNGSGMNGLDMNGLERLKSLAAALCADAMTGASRQAADRRAAGEADRAADRAAAGAADRVATRSTLTAVAA